MLFVVLSRIGWVVLGQILTVWGKILRMLIVLVGSPWEGCFSIFREILRFGLCAGSASTVVATVV